MSTNEAELHELAWRHKAERLIARLARQSFEQANMMRNGKLRKRHVPYALPALAEALVKCLDRNDEERAKALFLTHEGLEAVR